MNAHTLAGISAQTMQRSMPPIKPERVKRSRPSENVDAVGNGRSHGRRSHWHVELRSKEALPEDKFVYFSPPFLSRASAEFLLDQLEEVWRLLGQLEEVQQHFTIQVAQWVCDQQGEQL